MAKLEGITVEINGDATGLNNALKDTNKQLGNAQQELTQVNKLLKLDPSNTTLLAQKQQLLTNAVQSTSDKLATLKTAQEQAKNSGLTSTEAGQKAYRELEREIVSTENSMKKFVEQLEDTKGASKNAESGITSFSKSVSDAGDSTSRFGDIVKANLTSEAIIAGLKGMANLVVDVSKKLVELGTQAIEAYGEYEQLVGGVETLFKDSANIVQEYANNAYKTAGLSANEYMSTVTSFSASLLQSLDGDTAESAKIADMAITDMSDNANKMGTSMESIQNAYQGFAKQNYTMLDNLKLGYGGTKTEMERLLADATAISGVDYDISNLSDVYNAIHVIQGELDITGTTAKEASQTIQGSISAMKSSWQNLLVGMADGTQDMGGLVSNFVDSILTVGDNVIPRIEQALDGIVELIVGLADSLLPQVLELGTELLEKLIEGITSNIGSITDSIVTVVLQLTQTLVEQAPKIIEAGMQVMISLVNGIVQALPELIPAIVEAVVLIVETLINHIDEMIQAGIDILMALIQGLIEALPILIENIPTIIEGIITGLTDNIDTIVEGGIMLTGQLAIGLIKAIPTLVKAIPQILLAIVNGFKSGLSSIVNIGKFIVEGIWQGILNAKDWLLNKIKSFAETITDGIKDFFGIHSPSRVMRDQVGKYLAQGIGVGFEKEMPKTISEMASSLSEMTNDLTAELNAGMPSVNQSVTSQNFYNTKTYQTTTEVVRQPSEVVIQVDKTALGKVVVPAYNAQMKVLGGTLA